jgi:hypothetical protein
MSVCFFVAVAISPTTAGEVFDGTYLSVHPGFVEYFSLTRTDALVAGFLYGLRADPTAPDGIRETRINVSGTTDGDRVNFRQGEGVFSTTLGWSAVADGNGFNMSFQATGGYLQHEVFERASNETINAAIATFRMSIGQLRAANAAVQQRTNVQSELADSTMRLERDIGLRPSRLQAIIAAKAAVARADAQEAAAENEIAAREADVVTAQHIADDAKATATTGEELAHVGSLQADVGARQADVGGAQADLGSAHASQSSANYQLAQARRDNAALEARIAQLRQIIARDKAYLH